MLELVFVTCLILDRHHCEERHVPFQDVSLMARKLHGQAELANWTNSHPGWRLHSWTCRIHDPRQADA